jgi:GNAT superfamily N-acetyltransferase
MFIVSPLLSSHITIHLLSTQLALAPLVALPEGFTLRGYLPGDRRTWVGLQRVADPCLEVSEETFNEEFGRHQPSLISRQFYALTGDGRPVGTTTAWFSGKASGLVKGLAVVLAYSGCGLEEALLSEAIRRFESFGYEKAEAALTANRLDLVRLFLKFGFQPDIRSLHEEAAWKDIQGAFEGVRQAPALIRLAGWLGRLFTR